MLRAGLVGRKVDLRTPVELSRYFRDKVLASAVLQYAARKTRPPADLLQSPADLL
jgi:hypothetical protein